MIKKAEYYFKYLKSKFVNDFRYKFFISYNVVHEELGTLLGDSVFKYHKKRVDSEVLDFAKDALALHLERKYAVSSIDKNNIVLLNIIPLAD